MNSIKVTIAVSLAKFQTSFKELTGSEVCFLYFKFVINSNQMPGNYRANNRGGEHTSKTYWRSYRI